MTKRSKGSYGQKCQTFQCKSQMAPENTAKAQNINSAPRITQTHKKKISKNRYVGTFSYLYK